MFALTVTLRGRTIGRASFDQEVVRIGRTPDNDVSIDNPVFSRSHALIRRYGIAHVLEDLGTQNGTHLNGKRVQLCALNDGDRFTIGKYTLIFSCKSPALDLPAAVTGGGETLSFRPGGESHEALEACSTLRANLVVLGEGGCSCLVTRDVFIAGAAPDSDLVLAGWLVPRKVALITRGFGGFSLVSIASERHVLVNGKPIAWQAWLEDGDELVLAGTRVSFAVVQPTEDPLQSDARVVSTRR